MTTFSTISPAVRADLLRKLRAKAGEWLQRFYRHEVLVARAVKGIQIEVQAEWERDVVRPLLREVGGRLSTFDDRGIQLSPDTSPELRSLLQESNSIIRRGTESVRLLTEDRILRLGRSEAEWVAETATRITGEPVPVAQVDTAVRTRNYLGDDTERWFAKMLEGPTGDKVRERIVQGLQAGQGTDEIVRSLRGAKTQSGVLEQSSSAVATLVRTAATAASSSARNEGFVALGVAKWRFLATLDSKTSVICASLDGKTFPAGQGPMPPRHPNCRSTAVPFFGDPIGDRASIDGPVPADTTFAEWLDDQDVGVQNEVLGQTKAAAWRAGDITLEQMLGRDLQPLTLSELRRLDRLPGDDE